MVWLVLILYVLGMFFSGPKVGNLSWELRTLIWRGLLGNLRRQCLEILLGLALIGMKVQYYMHFFCCCFYWVLFIYLVIFVLVDDDWMMWWWLLGPGVGGDYGPYRQSERNSMYKQYAEKLLQSGQVYRCFCSDEVFLIFMTISYL